MYKIILALLFFVLSIQNKVGSISVKSCNEIMAQEALATHNLIRSFHGVGDLVLSKELCQNALAHAEHLISIDKYEDPADHKEKNLGFTMVHLYRGNVEFDSDFCKFHGREIVNRWYSTESLYSYDEKIKFPLEATLFTQIVWASTKEVGFGLATVEKYANKFFFVAYYSPQGNKIGEFSNNVFKPNGMKRLMTNNFTAGTIGFNLGFIRSNFENKTVV